MRARDPGGRTGRTPRVLVVLASALLTAAAGAAQDPGPLGSPAGWTEEETTLVELRDGATLRAAPDAGARSVATVSGGRYAVLGTSGAWFRVRSGDVEGWVDPLAAIAASGPAPAVSPQAGGADREEEVLRRLGAPFARWPLGDAWVAVYGRDPGPARRERWEGLVGGLPAAVAARTGRPARTPAETVHLGLADHAGYDELRRVLLGSPGGRGETGAAAGRIALVRLEPAGDEIGVILHELAHLLLPDDLAPWLAEGLAEDAALASVGPDGELRLDPLGVSNLRWGPRLADLLQEAEGRLARGEASLRDLVEAGSGAFAHDGQERTPLAGLFVRYLAEREPATLRLWVARRGRGLGDEAAARQRHFEQWLAATGARFGGGRLRIR